MYSSYSYLDLQYMEFLLYNNMASLTGDDEENRLLSLILLFLKFRMDDGSNILHILPTNEKFLHFYAKVINTVIEECEIAEAESYYFSVIYPNKDGKTPLDLAIEERASRSVEIMLDMLSMRP